MAIDGTLADGITPEIVTTGLDKAALGAATLLEFFTPAFPIALKAKDEGKATDGGKFFRISSNLLCCSKRRNCSWIASSSLCFDLNLNIGFFLKNDTFQNYRDSIVGKSAIFLRASSGFAIP